MDININFVKSQSSITEIEQGLKKIRNDFQNVIIERIICCIYPGFFTQDNVPSKECLKLREIYSEMCQVTNKIQDLDTKYMAKKEIINYLREYSGILAECEQA